MVNFQKLESSVASLEKQLQEVKEQLAEVRNEYQEECHPGKTDIREYILEKATERFGENYMKPEEDIGFFDDFYDAVKRKVKKDSMIMGYSENGAGVGMALGGPIGAAIGSFAGTLISKIIYNGVTKILHETKMSAQRRKAL
ncbi:MAG: DUF456 domain-containing protein, partial [Clostridium sp.]|nr:DUF456 domain-containing protein [Clostridium sp.]